MTETQVPPLVDHSVAVGYSKPFYHTIVPLQDLYQGQASQ